MCVFECATHVCVYVFECFTRVCSSVLPIYASAHEYVSLVFHLVSIVFQFQSDVQLERISF